MTTPEFSELLRRHRRRAGQTQQQLADLSAMSVRAIRDLERGRVSRPRRETVRLIADGLGLDGRARLEFETAAGHLSAARSPDQVHGDVQAAPPPTPLDTLLGRDDEVAALQELLVSGSQRLVTVTGLGGAGKTRLALEVAGTLHRLHGYPVLWASPSWLARPDRGTCPDRRSSPAGAALARLLDPGEDGSAEALARRLGDRPALLVVPSPAWSSPSTASRTHVRSRVSSTPA